MSIRQSIGPGKLPFELEWALRACNNGLVYGEANTTVEALLAAAAGWDEAACAALEAGNHKLHGVYSRHAERYMHAAEQVELHNGRRT